MAFFINPNFLLWKVFCLVLSVEIRSIFTDSKHTRALGHCDIIDTLQETQMKEHGSNTSGRRHLRIKQRYYTTILEGNLETIGLV